MPSPITNRWGLVAAVGGLAYPFLVYFGFAVVSPGALIIIAFALIALRMIGLKRLCGTALPLVLVGLAGGGLGFLLMASPDLAIKAYPIAVSLGTAALFLLSLAFPPTIVERIARLTEPDLSPTGIAYTRKVTKIWAAFLIGNAMISAVTAMWGSLAQWTLWNGLLSYIAMGGLFLGERILRRRAVRREDAL